MATRIRTLNFLPEIFKTPTNRQFLSATLDQIVAQPDTRKIQGYIGSKFGYGINARDYYVTEPTKTRTDYQLDPGVVFTKPNESNAQDFISYPGILDALKLEGGLVENNNRIFNSEFYSWDSFTDLDKIINFNQYYWIPEGPDRVIVATETVFSETDYTVYDYPNGYNIIPVSAGVSTGSTNPTLTLLRGGTYRFNVNQDTQFWIQGEPGVTGFSATQPNLQTRDVYGVDNNGASLGVVTFTVPQKNAQDQYNFPGNNFVDVVSTVSFEDINGALANSTSIDGVTSLNGLTVMFYNTGIPNEVGYVSNFYDYSPYDQNTGLNSTLAISVTTTTAGSNAITCNSTTNLIVGGSITFTGVPFGGLNSYSATLPNTIYYVQSIIDGNNFRVSLSPNGPVVSLSSESGSMVGNINQGQYEEGFNTNVNQTFYTIQYIGTPDNYVIRLVPTGTIPINQKITARFGTQYGLRNFYSTPLNVITLIPYISAPLDTLYYQDGTSNNKVGVIKLIESNETNTLNVNTEILGKTNFTSTNGVVFTNGLKVSFQGDVIPLSYKTGEYYVEGVGTSINLINVDDLVCPEDYTESVYTPWDVLPWGIGAWEGSSNIPVLPDYITISRNSFDRNAWSRSNRWFHIDVINATAQYNNNPDLVLLYTNNNFKAKRPIVEFYGNLKLFNSGTDGKPPVDFIDTRTTDALNQVAGQENFYPDVVVYTSNTANISAVNSTPVTVTSLIPGQTYIIKNLGTTTQTQWNAIAGTTGITYQVNQSILCVNVGVGTGTASQISTNITIPSNNITGVFQVGQYIADSTNQLPNNTYISKITGTSTITLTVNWSNPTNISGTSVASIVATDTTVDNYALFDGATIIFANDTGINVRNKIYSVSFATTIASPTPVIQLTEIFNGTVLPNQQTIITRGYNYQGKQFYFDGINWKQGQTKINVNQAPLFDILDNNNISFGNEEVYIGTSFAGCKLFSYGIGTGLDDVVLGFPVRYSSIDNVGDISFDVSLNLDTFNYVSGSTPKTQKVNTGYVHQYTSRTDYTRQLGWQTAVSPSVQYQIFEFDYDILAPITTFKCDIAPVDSSTINWPVIQVYINNVIQSTSDYIITTTVDSTSIVFNDPIVENTVVQILILSDQVSKKAYYSIPINLNNNPLNSDITTANVGDIRGQYQSSFYNNPNATGDVFGPNNYRDLGNMVPWGNRIIQNSASLVLPGTFLRKQDHNLFNSLLFNSREYINYKTLLMEVVNNTDYSQRYDASTMLDDAISQITARKTETQPFFWSDMLPNKAANITNSYTFVNDFTESVYGLSRTYDFTVANYYGVLVYLKRVINNIPITRQLIINRDYVVSTDSPSLTVTMSLTPGDVITIKEYIQTYGSYVPNTPTKLGLYPASIPSVVLDDSYSTPTYFIKGHDGSYTKLFGNYDTVNNVLIDFRDQVLLEFETRIYNNIKLNAPIPIIEYDLVPGFFRETDYSYNEWLSMYSVNFLDWVGQNRLNYKRQIYNSNDEFSYNYSQSGNALNKQPISQGYWRGIYEYFYDTTTPNATPWEMLGFVEQPEWWTSEYGPAPYTSDNLILWNDLENGIIRQGPRENVTDDQYLTDNIFARPGLTKIIPVDSAGDLKSPLYCVVGAYNSNIFRRDWKVGDDAPVEFSYRRSSTYPFDLVKLMALMKPAQFYNLAVDLDNYKYSSEFNQYLVDNRRHLVISDIEIYGNGTAKTSYINWIVDYEKQVGINATENITTLLDNLDVRLVYRLAGFSDKTFLKFFVEKGSPNSKNSSLLIPDESFSILLYDNQPFNKIIYSGVVVQKTNEGYTVFGNSQTQAYFKTLKPKFNQKYRIIEIEDLTVELATEHYNIEQIVEYGYTFYNVQELSQFLINYGAYLETQGVIFDQQENELTVDWYQMTAEFLYWAQTGWDEGSIITLNPCAKFLKINKDSNIVQPLTLQQSNFVLNQNLYPIQTKDLSIIREDTLFSLQALNDGDTMSYGQFNISNFEHGIVFDNITLFDDIIYNLTTGLRQNRILLRGTKSAEWNGTVNANGFILNQDNILEWNKTVKYTKGSIVKYKNKYWTALTIIQPKETFSEQEQFWKRTEYDEIQKGLLPNASTRAFESTLYYDCNQANLEKDADLLSFSLIGFRPRDYMSLADLTDITQVNVYKNMIKNKGTRNSTDAFRGANLPQGGINYDIYENWAILAGEFGGVLNNNFIEFKLNQNYLTGNPATVELTNGYVNPSVEQQVPLYSLFNYARPISDPNILSTIPTETPSNVYPTAGYVNYNDVKLASYFYNNLPLATNSNNKIIPLSNFYVRDYAWLAEYLGTWQVYSLESLGQVISVRNNLNESVTVTFATPHNLSQYDPFAIINFDISVNGYFIALVIVDSYRVIVPLALDSSVTELTGQGIGLGFTSQRVEKPSDINNLELLQSEFRKNTVWVDENDNGSWAVYRKGINYTYEEEFTKQNSQKYGSSVAYTNTLGYLIGDSNLGQVYRYTYNDLTETYQLIQTLSSGSSFGKTISYANDIFVISEPTNTPKVHIYQLEQTLLSDDLIVYQTAINAPGGVTNWGSATAISGDKNWLYISDIDNNTIHVYRKSQLTDLYESITTIDADSLGLTVSGDQFGYSISTDYYGDTLVVGTPKQQYSPSIDEYGYTYVFNRSIQNLEVQYSSTSVQIFDLAWSPVTTSVNVTATDDTTNRITVNSTTGINPNDPIIFTIASSPGLLGTNIQPNKVYFVDTVPNSTQITIKETRTGSIFDIDTVASITGVNASVQDQPLFVSVNGTLVADNNYAIVGSKLYYTGVLNAGDIINVSGQQFTHIQTLSTEQMPQVGVNFGLSVGTTNYASEIIVGAPFKLNTQINEGAVYRFTNGGGKYGTVIGTSDVNVTTTRKLLINGFMVNIPAGNATLAANAINTSQITNVVATTVDGKLVISLKDTQLAPVNEKLIITATNSATLTELGLNVYTQSQVIECPHTAGRTQFGTVVKFNEFDSFVASATVGTRYVATTFDFTDDENQDDDTIFDNNATQWVDSYPNAGAVYMFDYLGVYNESLLNCGKYTYAQSVNALNEDFGSQPLYGSSIDFNNYHVVVGAINDNNGTVVTYENTFNTKDWNVYRSSSSVVNIEKVGPIQIFSQESNNTLVNLDYIDPLQGKILGAARQNIDYVSNVDPAKYNSVTPINNGLVWGPGNVGQIWFDTSNIRYMNYHQNDVVYNSKYWASLFPGSDVAIYTWIVSTVTPGEYQGPGIPLSFENYAIHFSLDSGGTIVPTYYYWVRNTNTIYSNEGKTLSDNIIAGYIQNPRNSGIAYFAPLLPNTYGLYNCGPYINANDSILHIGFGTGTNGDVSHTAYNLIRENYPDDFLPGLPDKFRNIVEPFSLYARLLDSLSGTDRSGAVVPDPYLPKAVQLGVLVRPRQSFFISRLGALKNYIQYANEVASQLPLLEILNNSFLYKTGEYYNTPDYWEAINWWTPGYNDSTRSSVQVAEYSYLSTLNVPNGTIATVESNGAGLSETYIYEDEVWNRIGLSNGTFRIKDSIYDYESARIGFGDNFFDTSPYDQYPSEETNYIVRALNEDLPNALLNFRNRGLILLFEYIQSETIESQNYLPWLNKTSLVDVSHTLRELKPINQFVEDSEAFLEGYINEVKPYHVVLKEFLLKYTGIDTFEGDITDFDLPSKFNTNYQEFITPSLVYSDPSTANEYKSDNLIWTNPDYTQWKQNYGVSLTGQDNLQMTVLQSYLDLASSSCVVDNAQGFPINGVIQIDNEQISYSSVDRTLNVLVGLTRGVNGTSISTHIPGTNVYMNVPPVVVLNAGRGYTEPPKVTAYIDTAIYPEPTRPAVLSAVMNLDNVLKIDVIDPGQGYAVLPEIIIDPAAVVTFTSNDVDTLTNTITLYAPLLQTGDLVRYKVSANSTNVGGLKDNEWYYVNLLETVPTAVIGLYTNYTNAVNDHDRVKLYDAGTGNHTINEGARASAVTSSSPIRENNISLRFDRTSYSSDVLNWIAGSYYGAYYAGTYSNSENFSSSSIQLYETQPPISTIIASNGGIPFEITEVSNDGELTFSTTVRNVLGTSNAGNVITLDPSATTTNASGSTIGFYVGMPIKFVGNSGSSLIAVDTTYYVNSIINDTQFTISSNSTGSPVYALNTFTVGTGASLTCYTGEVVDTAVIKALYPGIMNVTSTQSGTNALTIPLNPSGTGGTNNFYMDLPVFFTGDMFGGIVENQNYYVTTVIDKETFTMSENPNPQTFTVTEIDGTTDEITIDGDTARLSINEPIIFNTMVVAGVASPTFGGLISGTTYYVSEITGGATFKVSTSINGSVENLSTVIAATNTSALLTSQKNTIPLTTASGSNMIINVSLPISPGQVNGQQFTFYETSGQFVGLTATNTSLISREITSVITMPSTVPVKGIMTFDVYGDGTTDFYVNMPFKVSTNIGSLTTIPTYFVTDIGVVQFEVTFTSSSTNELTCDTVEQLYVGMPIVFSGSAFGNIVIGVQYFVKTIDTGTSKITISETKTGGVVGPVFVLSTSSGSMDGTGDQYIELSTSAGGVSINPGSSVPVSTVTLNQNPVGTPTFSVSYILGGYRVIITNAGSYYGYAVGNKLKITGNNMGGTTPANDLIMTVDTITSNGEIINLICSGTVPGLTNQYYLKVIGDNEFKVYSNSLMTIPVSGIGFPYVSQESTTVSGVIDIGDQITVADSTIFNLYDPVVFTGNVFGGPIIGQTYYIKTIPSGTAITISTLPNGPAFNIPTNMSGSMVVTKVGSVAFLPEPFYFDQSIVKYNNNLWVCVISNNDSEFIFGKWELLTSGDRRLNALDRIVGYYKPDQSNTEAWNQYINMPGNITELVQGISYPNGTYMGNKFAPGQQYPLDTVLTDKAFYPTEVNVQAIAWDGSDYLAPVNTNQYSGLILSEDTVEWAIGKLANTNVNLTDIIYAGNKYVITSDNPFTAIYRSDDGSVWTTCGPTNAVTIPHCSLNSVTYNNGLYVAVGSCIVSSTNTFNWTERLMLNNTYLSNILYGVKYISIPSYQGYIAVGKGQILINESGIGVAYDINLLYVSSTGTSWTQVNSFTPKGLYGIANNNTTAITVGEDGVIYSSTNGVNWSGINETTVLSVNSATNELNIANASGLTVGTEVRFTTAFNVFNTTTTYHVVNIISNTQIQLSLTSGGLPVTLTAANPLTTTYMYVYPRTATLRDIMYNSGKFIAVGDNGLIRTTTNGTSWTTITSGTTEDLNGITYNSDDNEWTIVGDENTILKSVDNGVNWTSSSFIVTEPTVYDVTGAEFEYGYGPEEMVPGVVKDNMTMLVATRPGTNWPAVEYEHVGYFTKSLEFTPTSGTQTVYSFLNAAQTPIQVAVFVIDGVTGLATRIYTPDYSVNWINSTITLSSPLNFSPVTDKLLVDVYEVGNGDQLVKANSFTDPIRDNEGLKEIYVNCNYSGLIWNGSGIIKPFTYPIQVRATETDSTTNTILCDDVTNLVLNSQIKFQGSIFGGVLEDTAYYIKTISYVTNRISVSSSSTSGIAGPTVSLTDGTGNMYVVQQVGTGLVYTDPIVYHNGTKLELGMYGLVLGTSDTNNSVKVNTTSTMIAGQSIVFDNNIVNMGPEITPLTPYTILSILDNNELILEDPLNPGNPLDLPTWGGGAEFVTNDYSFGYQPNGIQAKIVFANQYNQNTDYLVYSLFGETEPIQYGYTVPETQLITADGTVGPFTLLNYVGGDNPDNAIVEVNGVRQLSTGYTINFGTNDITFASAPVSGDQISVTSFNLTERQYLDTNTFTGATVANIVNISNNITPYTATVNVTNTNSVGNVITCNSTAGFVVDATIIFKGTGFGGINTGDEVYFIESIDINGVDFTIKDKNGTTITLTTASGLMLAYVGGQPAVRVTTGVVNNLSTDDIVRIDGVVGSVQLNNNTYYARVIDDYRFDLYTQPYDSGLTATNYPVTAVSTYVSGGYTWINETFVLYNVLATGTNSSNNRITVSSTSSLVAGTPVYFTESGNSLGSTIMGGIVSGEKYYIKEINSSTEFTISETRYGTEFVLTTDSGTMTVCQWQQLSVDRLYVTVNGLRVPSSKLRINPSNYISILTPIVATDDVVITFMVPSATPNEEVYMLNVNSTNEPTVYRANGQTRTWLTQSLYSTQDTIYVHDVSRLTNTVVQNVTTPVGVGGIFSIGLSADKDLISNVKVYNNNPSRLGYINSSNYEVVVESLSPILKITDGSYIDAGDQLTITTLEGNILYLNGEQIKFRTVDTVNNTLSGLQRGANITGEFQVHEKYSEVYSILSDNKITDVQYGLTWNSKTYNTVEGDPLQVSTTATANFLNQDIN